MKIRFGLTHNGAKKPLYKLTLAESSELELRKIMVATADTNNVGDVGVPDVNDVNDTHGAIPLPVLAQ